MSKQNVTYFAASNLYVYIYIHTHKYIYIYITWKGCGHEEGGGNVPPPTKPETTPLTIPSGISYFDFTNKPDDFVARFLVDSLNDYAQQLAFTLTLRYRSGVWTDPLLMLFVPWISQKGGCSKTKGSLLAKILLCFYFKHSSLCQYFVVILITAGCVEKISNTASLINIFLTVDSWPVSLIEYFTFWYSGARFKRACWDHEDSFLLPNDTTNEHCQGG